MNNYFFKIYIMHYIMLEFRFLHVGLRKTIEDNFQLVGKKKFCLEKTGKNPGFSIDTLKPFRRC